MTWKTSVLAVLLISAAVTNEFHGQESPVPESTASHARTQQASSETILLHHGTPFCLHITQGLSTDTVHSSQRVTFRVGDEISVEGLTVIAPGTEVKATVTAEQPGRPNRDGKLLFVLDKAPLVNGQSVAIRRMKEPPAVDDDIAFWRWVLTPFGKGDPKVLDTRNCLRAQVKEDVTLNKAEISALQQPSGWKFRLQHLLSDSTAKMDQLEKLHILKSTRDFDTADEIAEYDLPHGRERRIGKCRHCFSPIAKPNWTNPTTGDREIEIFFLEADGLYALYNSEGLYWQDWNGNRERLLKGHFSAILAIFDWEAIVLEQSPAQCRIFRVEVGNHPATVLDTMDCKEITADFSQPGRLLRPAQFLDNQYVGDIPSQAPLKHDLVTVFPDAESNQVLPILQSPAYSRFDPTWEDAAHIAYIRKAIAPITKAKP